MQASTEMFESARTKLISSLTLHEKVFLCSVVLETLSTGLEETTFEKVASRHFEQCEKHCIALPTHSQLMQVCYQLGTLRLIVIDSFRNDLNQKILLNVSSEDVSFGTEKEKFLTDSGLS